MKRHSLPFLLLLLLSQCISAQTTVPVFGKIDWISGYAGAIAGEKIGYYSAYPDYATVALLTRCTDGQKAIEWETAPAPKSINGQYVYFSWVAAHSSGTSSGVRHFDLYVDGEKLLTFTTLPAHQRPNWSFAAPDSSRLVFQQTKRDGANDAHGLAFLRVPAGRVKPGRPLRLKVVGHAQHSNDWYMTFQFSFEEKVDVEPMPFLLKNGTQPALLSALHFGKPQPLEVQVNHRAKYRFTAQEGVNTFDIPLPAVQHDDSVHIRVSVGQNVLVDRFVLQKPVVHRVLHFIHHSHTDIGYSHLQPDVAKIHNKNIDDALAMIEATKHLPEEARFKWNIESLWAVENYLREATPEQEAAFVRAVRAGSIGLSALYANILTGLSQPEELFHYTDYAAKLEERYGFDIKSAMISDIPGVAWTTVTALAKAGVRYFSSGPNYINENFPYLGDRVGHFDQTWGDKPVWWTSPSGEETVLFWTAARGYSSWHGTAPGAVFERGPKKIAAYLNELARNNYPYEIVQWRYNIVADNGPIDTAICRFVDAWNKKYASPQLVLNTTEKLFEAFEQRYGEMLPTVKGDLTPYWEDGAVSTAREEGKNRANSLRLQQLGALYAMINPAAYDREAFYEAWRSVLLFHEHTWGAHNSIAQPDIPFVTEQWRIKKQFLLDADAQIDALEQKLFQPLRRPGSRKIAVFNTLSWKRSGPVVLSQAAPGAAVKDAAGRITPLQQLSNGNSVFIATDVPALGAALYEIVGETAPPSHAAPLVLGNELSNGNIRVRWDKQQGSIRLLQALENFNFAGDFNRQGMNSYWYVPGLDPAMALTNDSVRVRVLEQGPVLTSVSIASEAPGAAALERVLTLFAGGQALEIENMVDKLAVREKESLHFGFPFHPSLSKATLDAGYGALEYLGDQLPGSNLDYLYGRRWMDASAPDKGLQWLLLEAPLLEPEAMIDERRTVNGSYKAWKKEGRPTSTWFSYVMNNYWHTNYKADQEGLGRFRYALRPHGMFNAAEAEKAAAEFTQPLVAVPVQGDAAPAGSLFELTNPRIVVAAIEPRGNGVLWMRLFNPEPAAQTTRIAWKNRPPAALLQVGAGVPHATGDTLKLAAMGVAEYLIQW